MLGHGISPTVPISLTDYHAKPVRKRANKSRVPFGGAASNQTTEGVCQDRCGCSADLTNKESVARFVLSFSETHLTLALDDAARTAKPLPALLADEFVRAERFI